MEGTEPSWHDRASARLIEARKNGRLRSKKVRSGCITCKARKVKCDEQKPECGRCSTSGRRCEGYSPSPSSSTSPEPDQSHRQLTVSSPPPQFHDLSDRNRRKLDFFIATAGPQLAGELDQDFWCQGVLQFCQHETFAMDSVLAISTLYEHPQFLASFYSNPHGHERPNSPDGPPLNSHHLEALIYYNKAIKTFKTTVLDGRATPLSALMSCSLFLCIELIRDNVYAALELYKRGAQLLRHCKRAVPRDQTSSLLRLIRLMFARVSALAPVFSDYVSTDTEEDSAEEVSPTTFPSMTDARNRLFALMIDSDIFVRDADEWMSAFIASCARKKPHHQHVHVAEDESAVETMYGVVFRMIPEPLEQAMTSQSPSFGPKVSTFAFETISRTQDKDNLRQLSQRQAELLHRLENWREALQNIPQHGAQRNDLTNSYLMAFYHATFIWLSTRLSPNERIFDTLTDHFAALLNYAELYLEILPTPTPTFTFEIGVTPALFLAAIKCRVPSFRRRAIALMLRAPKKECMHGSFSTAEFARGIIELEEAGSGLPKIGLDFSQVAVTVDDGIVIAEHNRIHKPELMQITSNGTYELKGERHFMVDGFVYVDVHVTRL